MFYVKDISTPANTSRLSPVVSDIKVWSGVIHRVEVVFPPGPSGLLHVTIWHGGHQVYPSTEGMNFAGDNESSEFNDFYPLPLGFNTITVKTYNEDDTYAHTCRVRFGVLPRWLVDPTLQFRRISENFATLIRRIGAV